jgi:hypothetical protein
MSSGFPETRSKIHLADAVSPALVTAVAAQVSCILSGDLAGISR